jgi:hypothetical protein
LPRVSTSDGSAESTYWQVKRYQSAGMRASYVARLLWVPVETVEAIYAEPVNSNLGGTEGRSADIDSLVTYGPGWPD